MIDIMHIKESIRIKRKKSYNDKQLLLSLLRAVRSSKLFSIEKYKSHD